MKNTKRLKETPPLSCRDNSVPGLEKYCQTAKALTMKNTKRLKETPPLSCRDNSSACRMQSSLAWQQRPRIREVLPKCKGSHYEEHEASEENVTSPWSEKTRPPFMLPRHGNGSLLEEHEALEGNPTASAGTESVLIHSSCPSWLGFPVLSFCRRFNMPTSQVLAIRIDVVQLLNEDDGWI